MVEAQKIISSAVLGPEALAVIRTAFDDAWAEIAMHFGADGHTVEHGRVRLAHAILAVADDNSRDVQLVKADALQVLRLTMPKLKPRP